MFGGQMKSNQFNPIDFMRTEELLAVIGGCMDQEAINGAPWMCFEVVTCAWD